MAQGVQLTTDQINEMKRLRKEGGYSDGEIAKHMGIARSSVYKYIGTDGGHTRYQLPEGAKPTANLKIVHQQMTIQGNKNVYQLSLNNGVLVYRDVSYSIDELKILLAELTKILSAMEKWRKRHEKGTEINL